MSPPKKPFDPEDLSQRHAQKVLPALGDFHRHDLRTIHVAKAVLHLHRTTWNSMLEIKREREMSCACEKIGIIEAI